MERFLFNVCDVLAGVAGGKVWVWFFILWYILGGWVDEYNETWS